MTKSPDKLRIAELESEKRITNYLRDIERRANKDKSLSEEDIKEAFDFLIGKSKNKFLKKIYQDETGIVHKIHGADACFEELFGSLCGHTKQEGVNGIPTLIEKLREKNLLFSSKEIGVDYITSGVQSGIHKKGFTYLFAFLDEDGNIFFETMGISSGGLCVMSGSHLSYGYVWYASHAHRVVVPAKTLDTQT